MNSRHPKSFGIFASLLALLSLLAGVQARPLLYISNQHYMRLLSIIPRI